MAAAADELSKNIRDQFLQCKICLDGLKEPKTLPCLHTFCAECIICYAEHNIIDNRKFACPICRRSVYIPQNGIDGFPDSFFVQSLNDCILQTETVVQKPNECGICRFKESTSPGSQSTIICVECKVELCDDCAKSHTSAKVTEDHTLLPLGSGPNSSLTRDNYCRVHRGETIKYYCETCNSPICLPCTFIDHKDHEVSEIKVVRQNFCEEISGLVNESQDSMIQLQQARDDLIELENELFIRKEAAKTDIRKTIQELVRCINDQETHLLGKIEDFFNTVSVALDRRKVDSTIFRLQRSHDFANQLLSTDTSPIAQLTNRSDAKENLQLALRYELPDITQHANKLENFMYFLPGRTDFKLGTLLKCHGAQENSAKTELRHTNPTTKALFMHKLHADGTDLGEVISVGILPSGDIVVLVSEQKKVKVFKKSGRLRYEFGDEEELQHPSDMVITKDGDIAITDCGHRCVKVFDSIGTHITTFGDEAIFGLPIALAIDETGRYIICDQAKERITVHRATGEILHEVSSTPIQSPHFIACFHDKVFVCDSVNRVIAIYSYSRDSMQLITKLTTPGNGSDAEFLDCSGICCDNNGNLLVSDNILNRIHVFNQRAELSHVTATGSQFLRPGCLSASVDNLLVVSQQRVSLDAETPTKHEVCVYRMMRADI